MSNVRVALRVRPLNKREEEQGAKIIVEVQGDNVRVTNLKVPSYQEHDNRARLRQFNFDFCYWSVDLNGHHYASQEMIYQDLGSKVLEAVFEGFNACVFAYGQSGSGKTYTMMGHNGNLGLIPRICQGLFEKMMQVQDKQTTFRTEVSFLEIYNERVGDLLRPRSSLSSRRQRHTLRVREHPKFGPCVQDLSKHVVTDFDSVQALIEQGNQNRSVAATKMHDHSSRSHAIFTINFTQARLDTELPSEVVSKIHLVDLAGSERATAHTSKIRLKEGANINKSLVALGGVICALAERSTSQCSLDSSGSSRTSGTNADSWSSPPILGSRCANQTSFVPYRDSVLTWLLKDSIGGNSKTIMVATISPASTAYNETISTLHYTQRAKKIVNKPIINEDPNVKLIRELKAEISRLRKMLSTSQMNGLFDVTTPESNLPVAEIIIRNQDKAQELTRTWIEKWHYFQQQMQTLSCKSCAHRMSNTGALIDCDTPYLVGISDVPSAGVHVFYLKEGEMVIGNENNNGSVPDIVLSGDKIASEHCRLRLTDGAVTLTPVNGTVCYLNGNPLMGAVKLTQGDIMHFANGNALRFEDPATWKCMVHPSDGHSLNELKMKPISLDKQDQQSCSGISAQYFLGNFPNSLAEELGKVATWDQCLQGLEVVHNFNRTLEMKMKLPIVHQVNCAACSQLCRWFSTGNTDELLSKDLLVAKPQVLKEDDSNSLEDDDSMVNSLNGNLSSDGSSSSSGIPIGHDGEQITDCFSMVQKCSETENIGTDDEDSSIIPALPSVSPATTNFYATVADLSEEDATNSWSDTDDFSYYDFGQDEACTDESGQQNYALTVNYLKPPALISGARQLSPIQECPSSRSPSPPPLQPDCSMSDEQPQPLSTTTAPAEASLPTSSVELPVEGVTISRSTQNCSLSTDVTVTSVTSMSSLTEVSYIPISHCNTVNSLDSDSLDDRTGPKRSARVTGRLEFSDSSQSESDDKVKKKPLEDSSDSGSSGGSAARFRNRKQFHSFQSRNVHHSRSRSIERCHSPCSSTGGSSDADCEDFKRYRKYRAGHVNSGLFERMVSENKRKRRKKRKKVVLERNKHLVQKGPLSIYSKSSAATAKGTTGLQWNQSLKVDTTSPPPLPQPKMGLLHKARCGQPITQSGHETPPHCPQSSDVKNCHRDFQSIMQIAFSLKEDECENLEQNSNLSEGHLDSVDIRNGSHKAIGVITDALQDGGEWMGHKSTVWRVTSAPTQRVEMHTESATDSQTGDQDVAPASFTADSLEDVEEHPPPSNRKTSEMTSWRSSTKDERLRKQNDNPMACSLGGQSWPSCDSLTMVYMGPEWGSTETNIIASIQSIENLDHSGSSSSSLEFASRRHSSESAPCDETSSFCSTALDPETEDGPPVTQEPLRPNYGCCHQTGQHFPRDKNSMASRSSRTGWKQCDETRISSGNVVHGQTNNLTDATLTYSRSPSDSSGRPDALCVRGTPTSASVSSPRYASTPKQWTRALSTETYTVSPATEDNNDSDDPSDGRHQYANVHGDAEEDTLDALVPSEEARVEGRRRRRYQDLWTISTYSNDDLGQGLLAPCLCKGLCRVVEAGSGNRSTVSTHAEVSTQTESTTDTDSGIQTQVNEGQQCGNEAQLATQSTQTDAVRTQTSMQTDPLTADAACQTHPVNVDHTVQTEDTVHPVQFRKESLSGSLTSLGPNDRCSRRSLKLHSSSSSSKETCVRAQTDAAVSTDPSPAVNKMTQTEISFQNCSILLNSEEALAAKPGSKEDNGGSDVEDPYFGRTEVDGATTSFKETLKKNNNNNNPSVLIDPHLVPLIPLTHISESPNMTVLGQSKSESKRKSVESQSSYGVKGQAHIWQLYQSGFYVGFHGSKDVIRHMDIGVTFDDTGNKIESAVGDGSILRTCPSAVDPPKSPKDDPLGGPMEPCLYSEPLVDRVTPSAQNGAIVLNTGSSTPNSPEMMDLEPDVFGMEQPCSMMYEDPALQVDDHHRDDQNTFQKGLTTVDTAASVAPVTGCHCVSHPCETRAVKTQVKEDTINTGLLRDLSKKQIQDTSVLCLPTIWRSGSLLETSGCYCVFEKIHQKAGFNRSPKDPIRVENRHPDDCGTAGCFCQGHPRSANDGHSEKSSQRLTMGPPTMDTLALREQRSRSPQVEETSLIIRYLEEKFQRLEGSLKKAKKSRQLPQSLGHRTSDTRMSTVHQPLHVTVPHQTYTRSVATKAATPKAWQHPSTHHLMDTNNWMKAEYLELPVPNVLPKNDHHQSQNNDTNGGVQSYLDDCRPEGVTLGSGQFTYKDTLLPSVDTMSRTQAGVTCQREKVDMDASRVSMPIGLGASSTEQTQFLDNTSHSNCPEKGRMVTSTDRCTCCTIWPSSDVPPLTVPEIGSDIELGNGNNLPEDIVQLLRECRAVRKKAWKELALAHQQLHITTATKLQQSCAIHGKASEEQ